MKLTKTDRGFPFATFTDLYDRPCSVQESSLATADAIWLGVDGSRMHLSREMVDALIPMLQRFVDTGGLE